MISGRNRGGWQIFASKFAAGIGAGYFITYTGFAYEYGWGVFAMLLGIIFGYLLFGYWASPKIHSKSKEKKFYTMGDFVYHKTENKFSMHLTNVISSLILFAWLLVGVIGGAKIINDFGLMSYEVAVFVTVLVVLVYIFLAGFKAVIVTDVIQSIIILLLMFIVTFSILGSENVFDLLSVNTGNTDIGVAIGFFLFGLFAIFSYSNMYQLCYAAENERKLKHGIGLAVVPIMVVAFLLLLIGLFMASNVPGLDSGLIFTEALKNFLPASLLPLAIILFFAGVMSSADTNIYAISSHYALSMKKSIASPIKSIRISIIVLLVITTIISLIFTDIVDVSIIAGAISMTLSLPMIYLISGGKKTSRFMSSTTLSILGLIVGISIFGLEPIAALFPVIGGAIGLLWWK